MLCEHCGLHPATTHIQRNVNGRVSSLDLCASCAAQMGFGASSDSPGLGISDLWGTLFGSQLHEAPHPADDVRCPGCGGAFSDIARSGRAGCARCYDTFYDRLLPSLQRIHGRVEHIGFTPDSAAPEPDPPADAPAADGSAGQIERLKRELSAAIDEQNYERAAVLRDEIKQREADAHE